MDIPPASFYIDYILGKKLKEKPKVEVIYWEGKFTLTGSWDEVFSRTTPSGDTDVIAGIALDNSITADLDIYLEDQSILPSYLNTATFPNNKRLKPTAYIMKSGKTYKLRVKGTASDVLTYSVLVYRFKEVKS